MAATTPVTVDSRLDGELVLVRHGAAARGLSGDGLRDPWLSEEGQAQAGWLAEALATQNIAALYSSPQLRAIQTAEAVSTRLGLVVQVSDGLAEFDRNSPEYVFFSELRERGDPRYEACLVHDDLSAWGTDAGAFRAGLVRLAYRLAAAHPGQRVVAVTHGGALNALLGAVLGVERMWFFRPENTGISRIAYDGNGRLRVTTINEFPHLLQPGRVRTAGVGTG